MSNYTQLFYEDVITYPCCFSWSLLVKEALVSKENGRVYGNFNMAEKTESYSGSSQEFTG